MTYQEKLNLCAEHGKDPVGDFIHDNREEFTELLLWIGTTKNPLWNLQDSAREAIDEAIHEIESYTDTENSNAVEKEKDDSGRVADLNRERLG